METWRENDRGVSPMIGTLLLVALAVVLSATVYVFASRPQGEVPHAMALSGSPRGAGPDRSFSVAGASPELQWGEVTPLLAGDPLTYDGATATDGTWCRETPDGVCVPTASFDPARAVTAGDRLRVHDADIAGKTLQLRHEPSNTLLVSIGLS